MVRRDDVGVRAGLPGAQPPSGCVDPAGASPVPVSARASGSRPQVVGGDPLARAGCQEPAARTVRVGGEQARGPQHEVKPAASTYTQSEGRAAHFTAKATLVARDTKRDASLGGVWGAARVQGSTRNTRGPSALPLSRQGGSYKPRAKSSAAQRESEGVVVLAMAASNNAVGGKDLCFGHARGEGTREGMAAKSEPNHPGAHRCVVQAQRPQRELGDWC